MTDTHPFPPRRARRLRAAPAVALVAVTAGGAAGAGPLLRDGDTVTRVGSAWVATWEQLEMAVASRPEREVEMVIVRGGREQRLAIRPDTTQLRTRTDARFEVDEKSHGDSYIRPDGLPSTLHM